MNPEQRAQYPNKLVVCERDKFTVTVWKRKKDEVEGQREKVFRCAIGQRMFKTPKLYGLIDVMVNQPSWTMPDSPWVRDAGLIPGTVLDNDDPKNPIKARWIGFTGQGIGFHGTADRKSIGSKASHGCIRLKVEDVEELFGMVSLGDPVYVD